MTWRGEEMDDDLKSIISLDSTASDRPAGCLPHFGHCGSSVGKHSASRSPQWAKRWDKFSRWRRSPEEQRKSFGGSVPSLSGSKTEGSISDIDKVPMDFSESGRIITDPSEAKEVFLNEELRAKQYFVRGGGGRPGSPFSERVNPHLAAVTDEPWFHAGLTREESNHHLMLPGCQTGSYLVRTSSHLPGCFILCVRHKDTVYHIPIYQKKGEEVEGRVFTLGLHGTDCPCFKDLAQLVWFYETNQGNPLPCKLRHPVTKAICIPSRSNPALSAFSL